MRKLIVTEFVSVDGVMEAPGGEPGYAHSGWTTLFPFEDQQGAYKLEEALEAEALLLGRVTYQGFAAAWPERDDPEGFAAKLNRMPKYVVTSTLQSLTWENSTALSGDVAAEVSRLKAQDGGPLLVYGSRTLVQALYEHDLVDEYRLMVFPVVLGSGRRLFPDDAEDKRLLRLSATKTFGNGVTVLTYTPAQVTG